MILEIGKFFIYATLIVIISKIILVKALRGLAENLNMKSRIVGGISGIATSIPELLTVTISSFQGLIGTSLYNIISSNVINFIQYIVSLLINKNYQITKNKGIIIQNILVILTIVFPLLLLRFENTLNILIVIFLIVSYIIFNLISKKVHQKYLAFEEKEIEEIEEKKEFEEKKTNRKSYIYIIYILLAGILLYFIGDALGNVLEKLAESFMIPEIILGILLGFVTSIPELITFFDAQKYYKLKNENKILGVIEATNNLLTSNMMNLFIIQAIGILIYLIIFK